MIRSLIQKKTMLRDKGGIMGIIMFFIILFTILIIGFVAVVITSLGVFASATITPVMTSLGVAGATNLSEVSEFTFGTLNKFITAIPWLVAFAYVSMLIFSVIFVMSLRFNPSPLLIGVYFMFVILLIFGTIIISNVYQDIHQGDDILGQELRKQVAMSYMILYSPFILTLIAFVVGIYMFVGGQRELGSGGFDV